jgi:hypothetical protein
MSTRRRFLFLPWALPLVAPLGLGACALMPGADPLRVDLAGIDGLPSEGLEMRFKVTLRVQNPNAEDFSFDGVSFALDLRGQSFASGVSAAAGSVPRYGEHLISVPVTVSGLALARQLLSLAHQGSSDASLRKLPYTLRGKLGGNWLGGGRFESRGEVDLGGLAAN